MTGQFASCNLQWPICNPCLTPCSPPTPCTPPTRAGRVHPEPAHAYRSPYQRDRDRIVHSSAFRRLAHKTQVFTGDMGDYHRSRLTHTLEVASIARTVGRTLRLNEDLIEALALAARHRPSAVRPRRRGRARRVPRRARRVQPQPAGAADRRAARNALSRFPGAEPVARSARRPASRAADKPTRRRAAGGRLLEVQVVDAADSIAYDAHDADDAVELGLLDARRARRVGPVANGRATAPAQRYAALDDQQFRRAAVHELIDVLVSDLVPRTQRAAGRRGARRAPRRARASDAAGRRRRDEIARAAGGARTAAVRRASIAIRRCWTSGPYAGQRAAATCSTGSSPSPQRLPRQVRGHRRARGRAAGRGGLPGRHDRSIRAGRVRPADSRRPVRIGFARAGW